MKSLLILRNETSHLDRNRIWSAYAQAINGADVVLVVNSNNTISVIKNRWGKMCSALGFEVSLPVERIGEFVADPESAGKNL